MYSTTFEEIAEGQLSIKRIVYNEDGSETWHGYSLSDTDDLQQNEEIAIFDSSTGVYQRFTTITAAKVEYDCHCNRLRELVPVKPEWMDRLERKFNRKFSSHQIVVNKRSDI